jgi:hypothetical protein
VSLTILRGAVLFGLNPGLVTVRRSKQTYGVGILKRFVRGVHPPGKYYTGSYTEVKMKFYMFWQNSTILRGIKFVQAVKSFTLNMKNIYMIRDYLYFVFS